MCMCPHLHFLGLSQLETQSCFPKARGSPITLAGQTLHMSSQLGVLGKMPKHHLRKSNQLCLNDCSGKLERETNSFAGQRPKRRNELNSQPRASLYNCALGEAQVGEQMNRTCLPTGQGEGPAMAGNRQVSVRIQISAFCFF